MKKQNLSRGFTIVELLIVIVIIAILAAVSIVAYNGIQARAKTATGQALASQIAKKAEAYNTVQSAYPADVASFASVPEAALDDAAAVVTGPVTAETGNGGANVGFEICGDASNQTGVKVSYWDYSAGNVAYQNAGKCS